MTDGARHPWAQQPDEPVAAYSHFLFYRNLGPARSLGLAYRLATGGDETCRAPGSWAAESSQWRWVERAREWDVHTLATQGEEIVTALLAAIKTAALKALAAIETEDVRPEGWADTIEALRLLTGFVPPDAVERVQRSRR